jgi:glycine/D-amino acid oxidase-like deaminating enzyme
MSPSDTCDVVVIGAGAVGAGCAYHLAEAGLNVTVLDRGSVAGGTTGAGEGNILVSDKEPGPELELALLSLRAWRELPPAVTTAAEMDLKGGLVVAAAPGELVGLSALADAHRAAGVEALPVAAERLTEYEPELAAGLAGGMFYPQDMQVQPMLAAAHLLAAARRRGARVRLSEPVTGLLRAGDRVTGVRTPRGPLSAGAVVNAGGVWGGQIAALAGVELPVLPRRGFILVTEPVGRLIRHKVYAASYVADVHDSSAELETSPVIEGTASGTVLIGSSRERVGFDPRLSMTALARMARHAIGLIPVLGRVRAMRAYHGFRPYSPDHLPMIGPDGRAPGLFHACGHEGAGIGLSVATGLLIAEQVTGRPTSLPLGAFAPDRFGDGERHEP